jgi:hypothetical protein
VIVLDLPSGNVPVEGVLARLQRRASVSTTPRIDAPLVGIAASAAAAHGRSSGGTWWSVDPVRLHADGLNLRLAEVLPLDALTEPLDRFSGAGWTLDRFANGLWLHSENSFDFVGADPYLALGADVAPFQPRGAALKSLRRWLSETEVLLHQAGARCNALWLSAGGHSSTRASTIAVVSERVTQRLASARAFDFFEIALALNEPAIRIDFARAADPRARLLQCASSIERALVRRPWRQLIWQTPDRVRVVRGWRCW